MELTRLLSDIQNFIVYYRLQNQESFEAFSESWKKKNNKLNKDLEKRLVKKYKIFIDKYASLLTQSENHEDVDYTRACLDEIKKEIKSEEKNNRLQASYILYSEKEYLEKKISNFKIIENIKFFIISIFPLLLFIIFRCFEYVLNNW